MAESRLSRTRKSLPENYQYGDARKHAIRIRFLKSYDISIDLKPQRADDWYYSGVIGDTVTIPLTRR